DRKEAKEIRKRPYLVVRSLLYNKYSKIWECYMKWGNINGY
ncbi:MAG: hypothetical protein Q620_VSAC01311G0001, partial [Veillonella sp. DORA_A_3_16_22]